MKKLTRRRLFVDFTKIFYIIFKKKLFFNRYCIVNSNARYKIKINITSKLYFFINILILIFFLNHKNTNKSFSQIFIYYNVFV